MKGWDISQWREQKKGRAETHRDKTFETKQEINNQETQMITHRVANTQIRTRKYKSITQKMAYLNHDIIYLGQMTARYEGTYDERDTTKAT